MLNPENLNGEFLSAAQLKNIKFKSLGKNVDISSSAVIVGCQNISIGNNVRIDPFTTIVASEGKLEISDYINKPENKEIVPPLFKSFIILSKNTL